MNVRKLTATEEDAFRQLTTYLGLFAPKIDADDIALARRFLDLPDEDFTFIDPEDIKRLARAVLTKVD